MSTNAQAIVEATGRLLVEDLNQRNGPGEKMNVAMSVAFNTIVSTAALMMGSTFDPKNEKFPTNDHVLLAALLICSGGSITSAANVTVEFGPYRIYEALEDFKRFTTRDGEKLLDPALLQAVKKATAVNKDQFGPNGKFLQ